LVIDYLFGGLEDGIEVGMILLVLAVEGVGGIGGVGVGGVHFL
jgi:hypothetical protein